MPIIINFLLALMSIYIYIKKFLPKEFFFIIISLLGISIITIIIHKKNSGIKEFYDMDFIRLTTIFDIKYLKIDCNSVIYDSNFENFYKKIGLDAWVEKNMNEESKTLFYKKFEEANSNLLDENNYFNIKLGEKEKSKYYKVNILKIFKKDKLIKTSLLFIDITAEIRNSKIVDIFNNKIENEELVIDKLKKILEGYTFVHFFFDKSCTTINSFINQIKGEITEICSLEKEIEETNKLEKESLLGIRITLREIREIFQIMKSLYEDILKSYKRLEDKTQIISSNCKILNSRVDKLNEMIQLIISINQKTNLLSINAGIIAANSGESGSGFNIIAKEIKKLSEGTQSKMGDIGKEIKILVDSIKAIGISEFDMNSSIQETSNRLTSFVDSFTDGIKEIDLVDININDLSKSLEEKIKNSSLFITDITSLIQNVLKNNNSFLYEIEEVKRQIEALKERNRIDEEKLKDEVILF